MLMISKVNQRVGISLGEIQYTRFPFYPSNVTNNTSTTASFTLLVIMYLSLSSVYSAIEEALKMAASLAFSPSHLFFFF